MKGNVIRNWIHKVFGDIKVFRHPMYIAYDPGGCGVEGEEVREVLRVLQPGDILLRRFNGYLDNWFIPGRFTHAAIYCGPLTEADRPLAAWLHQGNRRPSAMAQFKVGPEMVIHALAPVVKEEDILTFCRCDKLAILRLPEVIRAVVPPLGAGVPREHFDAEELGIDDLLKGGEAVARDTVIPLLIKEAVRRVGLPFDFDFRLTSFDHLYCSELVYACFKSVQRFLNVRPTMHRAWWFARNSILPDDFLKAGLHLVWVSRSVAKAHPELAGTAVGRPVFGVGT
jgi:hypothetical protein